MKGTRLASDIKYYTDYSKWVEEQGRNEKWIDSVARIMNMHRTNPKLKEAFKNPRFLELFELTEQEYLQKNIGGSQRALQFGGNPIMKHNAKMYNCLFSYCDRVDFFQEAVYWLLCGCGVGFSVQTHHVAKLPLLHERSNEVRPFVIPDSIEGWSDAFGELIKSYFYGTERIVFDYSQIRPKGAFISGGFKAPGSEGLRKSLEKCEQLLDLQVKGQGSGVKIRPIVAYDLIMHISDAVLSGGVRRSSAICLFSMEDEEMMSAKSFQNFNPLGGVNTQRARSNNSVVLHRKYTTKEQFVKVFEDIKQFGEPGFYLVDDYEQGTNPCITGDSWVTTIDGPKQVKDIIGLETSLLMNGNFYKTTSKGFWETGEKEVFEIELYSGQKIKATNNHKFLTIDKQWVDLQNLQIGQELAVETNNKNVSWDGNGGSKEEGWLLGNLIGDGTYGDGVPIFCYWGENKQEMLSKAKSFLREIVRPAKKNREYLTDSEGKVDKYHDNVTVYSSRFVEIAEKWGVTHGHKHINSKIEQGSSEFYAGVIGGLFDADGSVGGDSQKGCSVGITQVHQETLLIVQRMLLRLGIISRVYRSYEANTTSMPDGKGGMKDYNCQDCYVLSVSGRVMVQRFFERVFVQDTIKLKKLEQILSTYTTNRLYKSGKDFSSKIVSINKIGIEKVYDCTVPETSCFASNGFIVHNCCEIGLYAYTEDGRSGWQGCNLTTINGNKMTSKEKFFRACIASAVIGTIQATYTDFKYVSKESKEIFERESLLGNSVTGWMNNPQVLLDEEVQKEAAELILQTNKEVVDILRSCGVTTINYAARTTTVKPEGNTSVLYETASGCHGEHSPRYFRIIQINKESEIAKILTEHFPELIEDSIWSSTKSDIVAYIPTEPKSTSIFKDQLEGVKQLEVVKKIQTNWVKNGINHEVAVKPYLTHNVSNTVEVPEDQWDNVAEYLWENKEIFSGVSFLPKIGDKLYYQAPFTSVLTAEEMLERYGDGSVFASGLIVDGLHVFDNLWDACDLVLRRDRRVEGTRQEVLLKLDWIRRAKQFAKRYFKNDYEKMTYCLKDVHLYHKWCTINRVLAIRDLDFSTMNLQPNYTEVDTLGAASCAAGACELPEDYLQVSK